MSFVGCSWCHSRHPHITVVVVSDGIRDGIDVLDVDHRREVQPGRNVVGISTVGADLGDVLEGPLVMSVMVAVKVNAFDAPGTKLVIFVQITFQRWPCCHRRSPGSHAHRGCR